MIVMKQTYLLQLTFLEIGTLIWISHLVGRFLAASSFKPVNASAARLTHWQAICRSVLVGVLCLMVATPLQHSTGGWVTVPLRYSRQGRSAMSTCEQLMAACPGSAINTVVTATTTNRAAMAETFFIFGLVVV